MYTTRKIKKVCTIASIDEIDTSATVEEMVQFHIRRYHLLKNTHECQYAMEIIDYH